MCACVLLFGWNEVTIEIGRILGGSVLGLSWGAFIMFGAVVSSYVDNYVDKHVDNFGGIVDNFRCHIGGFYRGRGGFY